MGGLANAACIPRAEKVLRKASCVVGDAVGDCVKFTGPKVGLLYAVAKMDPLVDGENRVEAIIVKKLSDTVCVIQLHGPVTGVLTGLTSGRDYFVGSNSKVTLTPALPPPSGTAYVQFVGVAIDSAELMFAPEQPIKRVDG